MKPLAMDGGSFLHSERKQIEDVLNVRISCVFKILDDIVACFT